MNDFIRVGLEIFFAMVSVGCVYVMLQIKVAVEQMNTNLVTAMGQLKEWSRTEFAEKKIEERVWNLEMKIGR